jgi:hypothetical protein
MSLSTAFSPHGRIEVTASARSGTGLKPEPIDSQLAGVSSSSS